jgi:hypothetical protein
MPTTTTASDHSTPFLDSKMPNTARIFDYLLGGTANFEADRAAAENMLQFVPSLRKWVRLRKASAQESAQLLYEEGFRQFLDLASGIPTPDHIHALLPAVNVVYSDINPVAVNYGTTQVADFPRARYIFGNAQDIETILHAPAVHELLNPSQKVAIGLNALLIFLREAQVRSLAQKLYQWAPSQSKIFVTLQTRRTAEITPDFHRFLDLCTQARMPIWLPTLEECLTWLQPWQAAHVEPAANFLGLPADFVTDADHEGIGIQFYSAFFEK